MVYSPVLCAFIHDPFCPAISAFADSISILVMASSTLFLPALLASAAGVIVAITNITDTTLADHFHSLVNMISPRLRLYGWDLRTLIQVSERSNSGLSQVCFLPALPPGRQPALLVLQADLASRFVRHTQSPERRSSAVCSQFRHSPK